MLVQIENDFDNMFGDKSNMLFERWPKLSQKVIDIVRANVKDKTVLRLLDAADGDVDKGGNDSIG
jgi:hypothetical protein